MAIPAAAQVVPIVAQVLDEWVDVKTDKGSQSGTLTRTAKQFLQQAWGFMVGTNRTVPCEATGTNTIALTMLSSGPQVDKYASYDTYGFVAAATSTGNVSASVMTTQGQLATLNVYKTNGAVRAGAGDVVSGSQYFLTYVDSLNAGAGGFVLR